MQNVVTTPFVTLNVTKKNLPFGNTFVQRKFVRTERTRNGRNAIVVFVTCTAESKEPGRVYLCAYTEKGTLLSCITAN